jgi:hypothetical protein
MQGAKVYLEEELIGNSLSLYTFVSIWTSMQNTCLRPCSDSAFCCYEQGMAPSSSMALSARRAAGEEGRREVAAGSERARRKE